MFLFSETVQGQLLRGLVKDQSGVALPLATVIILPDSAVVSTGNDGRFVTTLSRGRKEMRVSYTGFQMSTLTFDLRADTIISVALVQRVDELKEITVESDRYSNGDLVQSTRSGLNRLTQKDLNAIPALMGEADLIKTLQLLPGTLRGVEGSSDLFVRGGAADQNLVLLDGAPIYNTSHLFGFLSVFNPDVLDHVEAINGGFPAEFGGRLSSILNVHTVEDVPNRTHVSGDIGLISSRLFINQPIKQDKAAIWVAGRRTYIDKVVRAIGEELPYFFYDINAKVLLKPSSVDDVQISYYGGEDILDIFRDANNDGDGFLTSYQSGNSSQSVNWQHRFINDWRVDAVALRTKYDYRINNAFGENKLAALSDIEDYGGKLAVSNDSLQNGSVSYGLEWTRHAISPSIINSEGTIAELLESSASVGRLANEIAFFGQREWSINPKLRVNAGIRTSMGIVDRRNYIFPEPRVSFRYALSENQAVKFNYSRMVQYMHRISNSAVSAPTDIWYTITDSIRPQTSHQFSAAWQRFIPKEKLYFSLEAYYKSMHNLIGFEEGTNLFFNTDFASKLVQGRGRAYGLEWLIRKDQGKLTGWLSYTLSWSWRQFDELNRGEWFRARYDRRHNGAIVMQYTLGKRWAASAVWEFISGARFTPVIGQYTLLAPTLTGFDLIPVYSELNAVKLADSHRLDLGIKFFSKPNKKFQWHWFAGVYNAYNRASPVGIIIEQDETDGSLNYLQPGLFGLLPFISYGFKF
ncbi:MAG TPA: TonB-dependent receptor [Chryseosolibacter sp.]